MRIPAFRSAYVARYRSAMETFLEETYLTSRVDALAGVIDDYVGIGEKKDFDGALSDMKSFIHQRTANVKSELATLP
ncbi:MAG: hypothetical protein QM784_37735 [Polyangiaceae bacterium]